MTEKGTTRTTAPLTEEQWELVTFRIKEYLEHEKHRIWLQIRDFSAGGLVALLGVLAGVVAFLYQNIEDAAIRLAEDTASTTVRAELSSQEQWIEQIRSQADDLLAQMDTVRGQVGFLNGQFESAGAMIRRLRVRGQTMDDQLSSLQQSVLEAESIQDRLDEQSDERRRAIEALDEQLGTTTDGLARNQQILLELDAQREQLEDIVAAGTNLLRQIDATATMADERRRAMSEAWATFESVEDAINTIRGLVEQIDELDGVLANVIVDMDSLRSGLQASRRSVSSNSTRLTVLGERTEEISERHSSLSSDLSAHSGSIAALEGAVADLGGQITDTSARLGVIGGTLASVDGAVQRLNGVLLGALDARPVLAFDHRFVGDIESCPEGWEPYEGSEGRFILGAGVGPLSAPAAAGARAGEQDVTLNVDQMPLHDHGSSQVIDRYVSGFLTAHSETSSATNTFVPVRGLSSLVTTGGPESSRSIAIALTGATELRNVDVGSASGGQSHNNMPPYIALVFCTPGPSVLAGR